MDAAEAMPALSVTTIAAASAVVITLSVAVLLYRQSKSASSSSGGSSAAAQQSKPVAAQQRLSLEDPQRKRIRVLFGTQTGTAERFSKQLGGELRKKYGESTIVDVLDLENYKAPEQLKREKLVVLCVATYGDGEPTDNAAEFFTWLGKEAEEVEAGNKQPFLEVRRASWEHSKLQHEPGTILCRRISARRSAPVDLSLVKLHAWCTPAPWRACMPHTPASETATLPDCRNPTVPPPQATTFAVFGLGNKQYEHFNAVGKKAFKCLETLGAKALVRRGDGDDDGCIDDDFDKWAGEFYAALDTRSDLVGGKVDQNGSAAAAPAEIAAYAVEVLPAGTKEVQAFAPGGTGKDHHSPYWATITAARELHTAQSDRSCVHVEVDISGAAASYEAGDHVAIYAQNSPAVVEEVAALLKQPLDAVIKLSVPPGTSGA